MAPRFIDIDSDDIGEIIQLGNIRNNLELAGVFIHATIEYRYQLQLMQRQICHLRHSRCTNKGIIMIS